MGKRGVKPTYVSFVCKECGKEFVKSKAQLNSYKNRTPITCSNECRIAFVGKRQKANRQGIESTCLVCGTVFYRGPANIKLAKPKFCSRACMDKFRTGRGNPFWNRKHSDETRKKISAARKGKCLGNKNALGYKHIDEAKKRIGEASKLLWESQRDMMLESRLNGKDHPLHKLPHERRYRKNFTPRQRKEWKADKCAFCGITRDLELDHIIPIFNGGKNVRENCQTLCRGCNLWKTHNIDVPAYYAALAIQGDPS